MSKNNENRLKNGYIEQRIEHANEGAFWEFYIPQVLRQSLTSIFDDISNTSVALILPLQANSASISVLHPEDLEKIGESLIGWLDRNSSFYTFLDSAPYRKADQPFEYPSDYRIQPLKAINETQPKDSTLVMLGRKQPLALSAPVVEIIRRLLIPLYEDVQTWRRYFDQGQVIFIFGAKGSTFQ